MKNRRSSAQQQVCGGPFLPAPFSAVGAGGATRAAGSLFDVDVHGAAADIFVVTAACVITAHGGLGRGGGIVGGDVAVGFIVAVA